MSEREIEDNTPDPNDDPFFSGMPHPLSNMSAASHEPSLPYSDYTNALSLIREHGANIHYCWPWKKWLLWSGRHWEVDDKGGIRQRAKRTVKRLARHAEDLDKEQATALLMHVKRSLSASSIKAMIELGQDEPGIPVQPDTLDTNPWLLNARNGTIDLRTGTLHPHSKHDLITRYIDVKYDPGATCPKLEAFLWHIMGGKIGDPAELTEADLERNDRARRLVAFIQRAIGYALTGDTSEQVLFVLHGTGANGKSTLLEVLQALLGDYATATPSATLLAKKQHEGIPNDVARLRGSRLVTAVEIGEGKHLNEELIKRLTGMDTVTARFLHSEFFDFKAEFKLFLACNHLPQIRGTDHAIWRRIRLIPFQVTIPDDKQDKTLQAQLKRELPGILRWAVQGCLDWKQQGLGTPEEVTAATKDYRSSQDVFEAFLIDETFRTQTAQAVSAQLYAVYERWCKSNDVDTMSKRTFGIRLGEAGFIPDQGIHGVRIWRGIGLPSKAPEDKRSGA